MVGNNQTACPQGDLIDCDDVISSDCYQDNIRHDCCNTCKDYEIHPLVPGCKFGDHWNPCYVQEGIGCYNNTVMVNCCETCRSYETPYPECRYGDKVENCQSSSCNTYSPNKRADCCYTCYNSPIANKPPSQTNGPSTTTWHPTTETSSSMTLLPSSPGSVTTISSTSLSSHLPNWAIPVAASAGGLLVIMFVVVIYMCIRRRKRGPNHLSPINERMYNDYKMSKRPPIAPPRHPSTDKSRILESQRRNSAEYAYINPGDVPDRITNGETNNRRSADDPLPQPPPEYLRMTNPDKYGYVEFEEKEKQEKQFPNMDNPSPKRHNTYQKFPYESEHTNKDTQQEYSNKL